MLAAGDGVPVGAGGVPGAPGGVLAAAGGLGTPSGGLPASSGGLPAASSPLGGGAGLLGGCAPAWVELSAGAVPFAVGSPRALAGSWRVVDCSAPGPSSVCLMLPGAVPPPGRGTGGTTTSLSCTPPAAVRLSTTPTGFAGKDRPPAGSRIEKADKRGPAEQGLGYVHMHALWRHAARVLRRHNQRGKLGMYVQNKQIAARCTVQQVC